MKIVDNRGQYKITLPKELVEAKGWTSGTKLRFVEDLDGNVYIKVIENPKDDKKKKR